MTEAKWLVATKPAAMIKYLRKLPKDTLSERKFRLCACACCRLIWDQFPDEVCQRSVEVAERYADGSALPEELQGVSHACAAYWRQCLPEMTAAKEKAFFAVYSVSTVVNQLPLDDAAAAAWGAAKHVPATAELANLHFARAEVVATIIRDIFGNPFRPVTFSPSGRTSTAVAIASQMYESRDFSAMPILADALQDAGCDSTDVLDHCRGNSPHVRGCWVVDLVLGKE